MTKKATTVIQKILLSTLLVWLALPGLIPAQNWDYELNPPLPVSITHLDAELKFSDTGEVEGDLLFTIQFRDNNVDSLVFDAPGVEIIRTIINEDSKSFYSEANKLVILLGEGSYERGDSVTLRIEYAAAPLFGLHNSEYGTFYSSMLPKAVSHWLPVIDHPRAEFTTEFIVTHPASRKVVMNGREGSTEVETVDYEVTTFVSNRPVSATGIGFVMGNLERIASTADSDLSQMLPVDFRSVFQRRSDPQIHIYSEISDLEAESLLSVAARSFSQIQESTGLNFPFRDLHIILLQDDFWETKPYGSGLLFVYKNRGDIEHQIKTGILSQWFGAHIREQQWSDSDAINLLRARAANQLFDLDSILEASHEPYHVFDQHQLSLWQYFLSNDADENLIRNIDWASKEIIGNNIKILSWNELSEIIYNNSGHVLRDQIVPGAIEIESEQEFEYTASMQWNENERRVEIEFQAIGESIDELVTIVVEEITFLDVKEHELTFTGANDSVVLSVSANVENIKLSAPDRDNLTLIEQKPFQFWIYQLQNEELPERRKEAAAALARYSDNPDLQLALRDLFNIETNPEVYAEITRSLSAITAGASGTEQIFLERVSGQQPKVVRIAAIDGLAFFRNNDQVIGRLRSLIQQTDDTDIRRAAIRSLYEVTEPGAFRNITEDLITRESVLHEVPLLLRLLVDHGEREAAVRFSSTFLSEGFPYPVRKRVLDLVLENDNSESAWENRLPALLSDRDPRIRYYSIPGLQKLNQNNRTDIIQTRLPEEYDERVRRALQSIE